MGSKVDSILWFEENYKLNVFCSGKTGNKVPVTSDWFQVKLSAVTVSGNQLDQNFQFVKDMLLEEVISEPLIHSAYHINQNLPTIHGLCNLY